MTQDNFPITPPPLDAKSFAEAVRLFGGRSSAAQLLGMKTQTIAKMEKGSSFIGPDLSRRIFDLVEQRADHCWKWINNNPQSGE